LREAVQAFLQKDADLAQRTMVMEEQANVLRNSIHSELMEKCNNRRLAVEEIAIKPPLI
jgi:hypothetical protein